MINFTHSMSHITSPLWARVRLFNSIFTKKSIMLFMKWNHCKIVFIEKLNWNFFIRFCSCCFGHFGIINSLLFKCTHEKFYYYHYFIVYVANMRCLLLAGKVHKYLAPLIWLNLMPFFCHFVVYQTSSNFLPLILAWRWQCGWDMKSRYFNQLFHSHRSILIANIMYVSYMSVLS